MPEIEKMEVTPLTTLREARDWLRSKLYDGAKCPCCKQMAKIYKRRLHATMAKGLIQLYRHGGEHDFVHTASLPGDTHEMSQASWWGLIEEEKILRPDGGRAGYWKLTEAGTRFVLRRGTIPEYALIYDSILFRVEGSPVSIEDCLGKKFHYNQLMLGE